MNKKKILTVGIVLAAVAVMLGCAVGGNGDDGLSDFDTSVPTLGENGWYKVFEDDFNGDGLNQDIDFGERYSGSKEIWTTSPHAIRWESNKSKHPEYACWWCPEMVEVKDSNLIVHSEYQDDHVCSGSCPKAGRFTGGIETRRIIGDNNNNKGTNDELLFSQAFGYFEVRAKFPNANGLWSAFWLQSPNMRKISNAGLDGTEIDLSLIHI